MLKAVLFLHFVIATLNFRNSLHGDFELSNDKNPFSHLHLMRVKSLKIFNCDVYDDLAQDNFFEFDFFPINETESHTKVHLYINSNKQKKINRFVIKRNKPVILRCKMFSKETTNAFVLYFDNIFYTFKLTPEGFFISNDTPDADSSIANMEIYHKKLIAKILSIFINDPELLVDDILSFFNDLEARNFIKMCFFNYENAENDFKEAVKLFALERDADFPRKAILAEFIFQKLSNLILRFKIGNIHSYRSLYESFPLIAGSRAQFYEVISKRFILVDLLNIIENYVSRHKSKHKTLFLCKGQGDEHLILRRCLIITIPKEYEEGAQNKRHSFHGRVRGIQSDPITYLYDPTNLNIVIDKQDLKAALEDTNTLICYLSFGEESIIREIKLQGGLL